MDASIDKVEALTLLEAPPDMLRWLEALSAVSTDGLLALDETGRILFANACAERLLGLPRQALLRLDIRELIHSETTEDLYLFRRALFTGEAVDSSEMTLLQPGGIPLTVKVKAIPLFDESGIFRGAAIS